MKINLVKNGIFPITLDINGNPLDLPDTGYNLPGTVQGEGMYLGIPSFIRLSGCNLRCAWIGADGNGSPCDTPYSSHTPEKNMMEIDDVIKILTVNNPKFTIRHVVISGGEPTLQTAALEELLTDLKRLGYITTLETNATIYTDTIADNTDLVSMSPKLSSSTPHEANLKNTGIKYIASWAAKHERDRINIDVINSYISRAIGNGTHFQLKFVVSKPEDIEEIKEDFISKITDYRLQDEDIMLMPEGVTADDIINNSQWVAKAAIENGWRFTPRLHTILWGTKRGV
jgi:7-carboxy-7-deazaguanine synthase